MENLAEKSKRLYSEAAIFDSETSCWKYKFSKMSQKYGQIFFETIQAMWQANGGCLTESEFISYHGLPESFFYKHIKHHDRNI